MRGIPFLALAVLLCASAEEDKPKVLSLPEGCGDASAPALASAPDGRAWLAYATPAGEVFACSWKPGEAAFSKPVRLAYTPSPMTGMHRGPRIAAWDKGLAVTWIGGGNLVCVRSAEGKIWKDPVRVNAEDGACAEGLHAMAATSDGQVWCCWQGPKSILMAARSKDGGATFGDAVAVQKNPVCSCCHPSLAAGPGGALSVMFRNDVRKKVEGKPMEECRDLYAADLDPKKGLFGEPRKLGKGTWKLASCPMDGGACALAKGLVTVWRRDRMILATAPGAEADEKPLAPGKDPAVAALASGATLAVWTDKDALLMLRLDPQSGDPVRVADPAKGTKQALPALTALPGGFLVAWEETPAEGGTTVKARWIPASP